MNDTINVSISKQFHKIKMLINLCKLLRTKHKLYVGTSNIFSCDILIYFNYIIIYTFTKHAF